MRPPFSYALRIFPRTPDQCSHPGGGEKGITLSPFQVCAVFSCSRLRFPSRMPCRFSRKLKFLVLRAVQGILIFSGPLTQWSNCAAAMRAEILAVGRKTPGREWQATALEEYQNRLSPFLDLEVVWHRDVSRT
mmetsp:Transcript_48212/g.95137  ORF Transcript_48212/g.95137 Transcript_48212/m.95137 type:complete len:133 (-) Transcript_48212:27-425(-)